MRQYLSAHQVQAANQIELGEIVEPLTMEGIKRSDPHPEIRLYSVGHEGQANLHLPGIGNKTFTWIQAAVRAVADKLKLGTAVFDRHDPDTNSHEGRTQIGQVVGRVVKQIGDRFNTLAAIHIFPQFKSRPLDVASIEADIEYDHDEHQAWPVNINSVSGIALSNSGIDSPGFPGATLLGAVQAYVQAFGSDFGDKKMNLSDVKVAVKDLGLTPTQIFGIDDIMGDTAVVGKVKEAKESTYNMSERIRKERDEARERITTLENTNAETDKKLKQHTMQSKSVGVLDAVLAEPERKLDDKAKIFIKRNLKDFSTAAENEDTLKVDVGKFVEAQVVEYGEQAKLFGVDVGNAPTPSSKVFKLPPELTVDGQKSSPGTPNSPANIPPSRQEVIAEEMNPDINSLIPGGKAAQEAQKT